MAFIWTLSVSFYLNEISACMHHLQKVLTKLCHWDQVTHICISKLTIIGLDNGLSPDRSQAIIWTTGRILSIGPLGTKLSEILTIHNSYIFIQENASEYVWKMMTMLSQPQCVIVTWHCILLQKSVSLSLINCFVYNSMLYTGYFMTQLAGGQGIPA